MEGGDGFGQRSGGLTDQESFHGNRGAEDESKHLCGNARARVHET